MSPAVKPIPDDYPRVIPSLSIDGAAKAIDFYRDVLGATERMRMDGPDGKVGHAELQIGESVIFLADEYPDMIHNWIALHGLTPEAERAYEAMGRFVRRVTR